MEGLLESDRLLEGLLESDRLLEGLLESDRLLEGLFSAKERFVNLSWKLVEEDSPGWVSYSSVSDL